MRVLVIEDDRELAEALGVGLRREQMVVDLAFDGDAGLERALVHDYDVIVLDRDLPIIGGDEVCVYLVRQRTRSRVLMLTAAATIEDRVDGLGLGADDYLPKPFAFTELTARIRALYRRAQPALPPVLERAGLRLDPAQRSASRSGRTLDLGPKEFGALELLLAAGILPQLASCAACGGSDHLRAFSAAAGGIVCDGSSPVRSVGVFCSSKPSQLERMLIAGELSMVRKRVVVLDVVARQLRVGAIGSVKPIVARSAPVQRPAVQITLLLLPLSSASDATTEPICTRAPSSCARRSNAAANGMAST